MTDLAAGLGLIQLRRLDEFQARRRRIVAAYDEAFADLPVERPTERPDVTSALHLYPLRLDPSSAPIGRDELVERLAERGIGTSVHFIPIHVHSYYRERYGWEPDDFPVAWDAFQRMLSLPLNTVMDDDDLAFVIDAVRDALAA
jgi:dTDP-4-amino-4,6-dideoxygalactose transaminase